MKKWQAAALLTLCIVGFGAQAEVTAKAGRYTVVGLLARGQDMITRLMLSTPTRTRIAVPVQNSAAVTKWFKDRDHASLVRVELVVSNTAPAKILKITPVRARRVPVYDQNLAATMRGNG